MSRLRQIDRRRSIDPSSRRNDREWKQECLKQLKQMDMFTGGIDSHVPVDKTPYKFEYEFEDDRSSAMAIGDWEIGTLYRNCLARAHGDED